MSLENIAPETRDEMAALLKKLSDHPKTRKNLLKSIKEVDPEFHIPELEIETKAEEVYSKTTEEVEKLRAELRERDAREELSKRRNSLLSKGKIKSEEDIEEIEKIMVEKKIADHEAAADYWNWMKQASEPTPSGYNPQVMKQWDLSKFMKNPQNAAREAAAEALNELRRSPKPAGL